MTKWLPHIKNIAENLLLKNEDELQEQIFQLKKRAKVESLEDLLPLSFALTQEIAFRKLGLRHYDTQLLAGIHLHNGNIVEMKTGEGKTLASTLPVVLNALTQKGVHVVTVNEYLAERDQKWMAKIYQLFNFSVGLVKNDSTLREKKESYSADITYLTNSDLVFDFLGDSSSIYRTDVVQRPFHYCIIDEIDSILIDEARTPLIISETEGNVTTKKLNIAKKIADEVEKEIDFQIDEKKREIDLTEIGYQTIAEKLGVKNLFDSKDPWISYILNGLKAKYIFKKNKDYILLNNKICIVDEFTGRVMEDRRWSMGIHEAIEVKENIEVGEKTKTKTSITYQNFFPFYPKLAGMTGTAKTAEKELQDIYQLKVIVLPTTKPMIRQDFSDEIYPNELAKWKAVVKKTHTCYQNEQPILIGTSTLEKSELLSELFTFAKIPHQLLNAKPENVTRESEIVAQAGQRGTVTIATNMAGRGTDIILGGNRTFQVKEILQSIFFSDLPLDLTEFPEQFQNFVENVLNESEFQEGKLENDIANIPYSVENTFSSLQHFYVYLSKEISKIWRKQNELIKSKGGLFVLGTERNENRRIDDQLKGRSGRQGDPGISQFYVSVEDDLIRRFGGDQISNLFKFLMIDQGDDQKEASITSKLLTDSLENAQKRVEQANYELRKNVFQYDDILNKQRKLIFEARYEVLTKESYSSILFTACQGKLDESLQTHTRISDQTIVLDGAKGTIYGVNDLNLRQQQTSGQATSEAILGTSRIRKILLKNWTEQTTKSYGKNSTFEEFFIVHDLGFSSFNIYQLEFFSNFQKEQILNFMDNNWSEHLERMTLVRETVGWQSFGQQNPLNEYNAQAVNSFEVLLNGINTSVLYSFLENPIMR